jgi:hypothetical protein
MRKNKSKEFLKVLIFSILMIFLDVLEAMCEHRNYGYIQGRREELRAGGGYFQKWEKDVVQSNSA